MGLIVKLSTWFKSWFSVESRDSRGSSEISLVPLFWNPLLSLIVSDFPASSYNLLPSLHATKSVGQVESCEEDRIWVYSIQIRIGLREWHKRLRGSEATIRSRSTDLNTGTSSAHVKNTKELKKKIIRTKITEISLLWYLNEILDTAWSMPQ